MDKVWSVVMPVLLLAGALLAAVIFSNIFRSAVGGEERANEIVISAIAFWAFFKVYELQRRLNGIQMEMENTKRRIAKLER